MERIHLETMRSNIPSVLAALAALVLATAGCDYYAKPYRPLPESFKVTALDGRALVPQTLRGKPWVINLWLPG